MVYGITVAGFGEPDYKLVLVKYNQGVQVLRVSGSQVNILVTEYIQSHSQSYLEQFARPINFFNIQGLI